MYFEGLGTLYEGYFVLTVVGSMVMFCLGAWATQWATQS